MSRNVLFVTQCGSCGASVDVVAPDDRCERCGTAAWRDPRADERPNLHGVTQQIEELLPASGRRPTEQIDRVVDGHLPDDRQAGARSALQRLQKSSPIRAGERAVWAGEPWRGSYIETLLTAGFAVQTQCDFFLATSERFFMVAPGAGRGKPKVSLLTLSSLSWQVYLSTAKPSRMPLHLTLPLSPTRC